MQLRRMLNVVLLGSLLPLQGCASRPELETLCKVTCFDDECIGFTTEEFSEKCATLPSLPELSGYSCYDLDDNRLKMDFDSKTQEYIDYLESEIRRLKRIR